MERLNARDKQVIGECLRAAADGPFFKDEAADDPYWEFHPLFGLEHREVAHISAAWPDVDICDESVDLAVSNSLCHLLWYPHGQAKDWSSFISASADEVEALVEKWRSLRGASK